MTNGMLIFVYNANSDLFSTITDFAHKVLHPSTYDCKLCALTYGNFFIKEDWKSFIALLPIKATFFHKDQFERKYKISSSYPAIFVLSDNHLNEIVTKAAIDDCKTIEELKNLIQSKYASYVQHHHTNL